MVTDGLPTTQAQLSESRTPQSFGSAPAAKAVSTSWASFRRSASGIRALASSRHPASWISLEYSALNHKSSKSLVYSSGSSRSLRIRIASCLAMRIEASPMGIRFMPASAMNADSIWSVSQPDGLTNAASHSDEWTVETRFQPPRLGDQIAAVG